MLNNTKEMYTKTVTLSPYLAAKLLDSNYEEQRKLNVSKAQSMARDIVGGRWNNKISWADPLMLTTDGKLMNGQHRCKAVILADKSITADIRYNVPAEFFENIDNGHTRTVNQFVKTKHAHSVSAVAKFANAIEQGAPLSHATYGRVSQVGGKLPVVAGRIELLEYIDSHETDLEFVAQQASRIAKAFRGGSKAMISAALWLIIYINRPVDVAECISSFTDDLCKELPTHAALFSGKSYVIGKQLTAARDHISLNKEFWLGATLAIYDAYFTRKTKIVKTDIDKALKKYSAIVDELRGASR